MAARETAGDASGFWMFLDLFKILIWLVSRVLCVYFFFALSCPAAFAANTVKMREVISIHIGQAGIQVGNACWELYCLGE